MTIEIPEPQKTGLVTIERVLAFARASGDDNPIHFSPKHARDVGLETPILHGMFIAARFEALLESIRDHNTVTLQVRFVRPVPVGSALIFKARKLDMGDTRLHLRLLATLADGPLVAIAEAGLEPNGRK